MSTIKDKMGFIRHIIQNNLEDLFNTPHIKLDKFGPDSDYNFIFNLKAKIRNDLTLEHFETYLSQLLKRTSLKNDSFDLQQEGKIITGSFSLSIIPDYIIVREDDDELFRRKLFLYYVKEDEVYKAQVGYGIHKGNEVDGEIAFVDSMSYLLSWDRDVNQYSDGEVKSWQELEDFLKERKKEILEELKSQKQERSIDITPQFFNGENQEEIFSQYC